MSLWKRALIILFGIFLLLPATVFVFGNLLNTMSLQRYAHQLRRVPLPAETQRLRLDTMRVCFK